jgi:hypothetical protein
MRLRDVLPVTAADVMRRPVRPNRAPTEADVLRHALADDIAQAEQQRARKRREAIARIASALHRLERR